MVPSTERDEVVARMVERRVKERLVSEERDIIVWNLLGITKKFEELVGRERWVKLCKCVRSWKRAAAEAERAAGAGAAGEEERVEGDRRVKITGSVSQTELGSADETERSRAEETGWEGWGGDRED